MARLLRGLFYVFTVSWPVLIYAALTHGYLYPVLFVSAAVLLIRLAAVCLSENKSGIWPTLAGFLVIGLALLLKQESLAMLYPVIVNSTLLATFGLSLTGKPIVQKFAEIARKEKGPLPSQAIVYTRNVTVIWTALFAFNTAVSALTVYIGDYEIWAVYNGFISYLLVGSLFAGEYLYRRKFLNV